MLHDQPSEDQRKNLAAYYTSGDVALALAKEALDVVPWRDRPLRILEPSAGDGAFIEPIVEALGTRSAQITLVEIDPRAVVRLQARLRRLVLPSEITVRVVCASFFDFAHDAHWDLVIGNPPFGRKLSKERHSQLGLRDVSGKFLEALLPVADVVALVVPKYFLHNAEYLALRSLIADTRAIPFIWDLGEDAFKDVKIETIAIVLTTHTAPSVTRVDSKAMSVSVHTPTNKLADPALPSWILYRDARFDELLAAGEFGLFTPTRDRLISSKHHLTSGVPLIRARDISQAAIVSRDRVHVDRELIPSSFWQKTRNIQPIVVPNLSYYPRAAVLPSGHYADGSAAMLFPADGVQVSRRDLMQYSSEEFFWFYRIARNYSVRSLNIDSTAAYYFGLGLPDLGASLQRDTSKLKRLRCF